MKTVIKATLLAAAIMSSAAAYADVASSGSKPTEIIFLQRAEKAVLNQNANDYSLVMKGETSSVTVFPTGMSNTQQKHNFLSQVTSWTNANYANKLWGTNGTFTKSNPNASLVGDIDSKEVTIPVQLLSASYNASREMMTYQVKLLNSKSPTSLTLHNPALFIDGACGGNPLCEMWLTPFTDSPPM